MSTKLWCAHCEELVDHDRGYLTEHYKSKVRGVLNTGTKILCDGSNTKPAQDLKTVKFGGVCTSCFSPVLVEYTEKYPGSLPRYGGIIVQQCPECSPEGEYCTNCDRLLHEKTVKVGNGGGLTPEAKQEVVDGMLATGLDQASIDQLLTQYLGTSDPTAPGAEATVWVDKGGDECCPDGEIHDRVHRAAQDSPVTLTDSHVIPVGAE